VSNKIKQQLVEVSKLMYDKGMVNAYEGNLSVFENGSVYITPSAKCKGYLTQDMIVVTDLDGNILEGSLKPSSEIKLHLAAYKNNPEIKSVIHAHSPYATAFAICGRPIETKAYPEMIVLYGTIPLADYGTPSTDEIYKGMLKYINEYEVILLANHGVVSLGRDLYETYFKLESVECIAKTLFLAEQLGGAYELPSEKLELLYEMRKKNIQSKR
jgi:L-fuculose-phosphate aldolase